MQQQKPLPEKTVASATKAPLLHFTPVGFSDLPDWQTGDSRAALAAFSRSCALFLKRDAARKLGPAYAGAYGDWHRACKAVPARDVSAQQAGLFWEHYFRPYALSEDGHKAGLLTGYYEPELRASKTRQGLYQTALLAPPRDLISLDLGAFRENLKGERLAGRIAGQRLIPYATRAQIEAAPPASARILAYAADPVDAFFLHIQGSGRLVFEDGQQMRINYAAQNGWPYTAIGKTLVQQGEMPLETVSMPSIRAWLKANPARAQQIMQSNDSYIFFNLNPITDPRAGSPGTQGVPLTAEGSMAVDGRLHPMGVPLFIATTVEDAPYHKVLIAQDTGGAIRGGLRGDIYWGSTARAERIAGSLKAQGRFFVLLPKELAVPKVAHEQ